MLNDTAQQKREHKEQRLAMWRRDHQRRITIEGLGIFLTTLAISSPALAFAGALIAEVVSLAL